MNEFFKFIGRFTILFKLGVIGFLTLLLLIPLKMVESILDERLQRREQAVGDITSTWGPAQVIAGPVLVVPYENISKKKQRVDGKKSAEWIEVSETTVIDTYFLPDELEVTGKVEPLRRQRGIYEAVLFRADLQIAGTFKNANPDQFKTGIEGKARWDQAYISLAVSDLRGVTDVLKIKLEDKLLTMEPGVFLSGFSSGVHVPLKEVGKPSVLLNFSMNLAINGSESLSFVPVGIRHKVALESPWPSPGFNGAFLPTKREVTDKGFNALWEVSYYGRKYPQAWSDNNGSAGLFRAESVKESQFGVRFLSMIDHYRSVERAIKYGILFIVLVFLTFFLFEITSKLRVHVFQYVLVGAALCLFYLALLSVSEVLSFPKAYLVSALVCSLMISIYSLSILRSGLRTLLVGLGMLLTYGFLYVILQMEDYSLLVGTIGLFLALGSVMYATRRINWYGDEEKIKSTPPSLPGK
jgi:inner membrane protein